MSPPRPVHMVDSDSMVFVIGDFKALPLAFGMCLISHANPPSTVIPRATKSHNARRLVPGDRLPAGCGCTGTGVSHATSARPSIISSQVCSPQRTAVVGSGLFGLLSELSKCATQ